MALLSFLFACVPCMNNLHTLFLFQTRRPKEEGLVEDAESVALDPDPILNFFRNFAPECSLVMPRRRPPRKQSLRATRSEPDCRELQEELLEG